MNSIHFQNAALILATLLANPAHAQTASGGGTGIRINRDLVLIDKIDHIANSKICTKASMAALVDSNPVAVKMLDALSKTHFYASMAFLNEARRIEVCFTDEPLRPLLSSIESSLFQHYTEKEVFFAYRYDTNVFIQNSTFLPMSELDQALLLIHEIAHRFLPMEEVSGSPQTVLSDIDVILKPRKNRLWSFVNSIYHVYLGDRKKEDFEQSILENKVALPRNEERLRPFEIAMRTAFNVNASVHDRNQSISFLSKDLSIELNPIDLEELNQFSNKYYESAFKILDAPGLNWEIDLSNEIALNGLNPFYPVNGKTLFETAVMQKRINAKPILLSHTKNLFGADLVATVRLFGKTELAPEDWTQIASLIEPNEQVGVHGPTLLVHAIRSEAYDLVNEWIQTKRVSISTANEAILALASCQNPSNTKWINALIEIPGVSVPNDFLNIAIDARSKEMLNIAFHTSLKPNDRISEEQDQLWVIEQAILQKSGDQMKWALSITQPALTIDLYLKVELAKTLKSTAALEELNRYLLAK